MIRDWTTFLLVCFTIALEYLIIKLGIEWVVRTVHHWRAMYYGRRIRKQKQK